MTGRGRVVSMGILVGAGLVVGHVVLHAAAARAASRLRRSWAARVAVEGRSMEPVLAPGDWLLVDPDAYALRPPTVGELVLVADPREPGRALVKRVGRVEPEGRLVVLGDAPDASTDSRTFGSVDPAGILGRPWLRYWPPGRLGRPDRPRDCRPAVARPA